VVRKIVDDFHKLSNDIDDKAREFLIIKGIFPELYERKDGVGLARVLVWALTNNLHFISAQERSVVPARGMKAPKKPVKKTLRAFGAERFIREIGRFALFRIGIPFVLWRMKEIKKRQDRWQKKTDFQEPLLYMKEGKKIIASLWYALRFSKNSSLRRDAAYLLGQIANFNRGAPFIEQAFFDDLPEHIKESYQDEFRKDRESSAKLFTYVFPALYLAARNDSDPAVQQAALGAIKGMNMYMALNYHHPYLRGSVEPVIHLQWIEVVNGLRW